MQATITAALERAIVALWPRLEPPILSALAGVARKALGVLKAKSLPENSPWKFLEQVGGQAIDKILESLPPGWTIRPDHAHLRETENDTACPHVNESLARQRGEDRHNGAAVRGWVCDLSSRRSAAAPDDAGGRVGLPGVDRRRGGIG